MAGAEEPKRIVCIPVDGSEHSERAFAWYCENLRKPGDLVVIIHAHELPTMPAAPYPYGFAYYEEWQHMVQKSDNEARHLLESFGRKCQQQPNDLKFKLFKETGTPGEIICKCAKEENCTLIVMGSRGMGTFRRTLLGSVSDFVVHHAHMPVAIVMPPDRHASSHGHGVSNVKS